MKYRFLGTAAAEGIPALFCNCPTCRAVRKREGGYTEKDFRTRSQSLIGEDLLIDLPADTNGHAAEYNLRLGNVRYLLLTHPHTDHLHPKELWHRDGRAHATELKYENIEVVCSEKTKEIILKILTEAYCPKTTVEMLKFHPLKPFETADLEDYAITALPATHMGAEVSFVYLIRDKKENKTVFHCNDTARLCPEVFEYFREKQVKIDFAEADCTLFSRVGHDRHMGYEECLALHETLVSTGVMKADAPFYINHFTHNDYAPHAEREKICAKDGVLVSYDGLTVTF